MGGDADVLICGASFAGLAVARELADSGARVVVLDRYEIGERQTSACAAPTQWLEAMGVGGSMRQTFEELVIHTPHMTTRMELPWTLLDLRLPHALRAAVRAGRRLLRDGEDQRSDRNDACTRIAAT